MESDAEKIEVGARPDESAGKRRVLCLALIRVKGESKSRSRRSGNGKNCLCTHL